MPLILEVFAVPPTPGFEFFPRAAGVHGWPLTNYAHKIYVPEGLSVTNPRRSLNRGMKLMFAGKRTGTPRPTNQRSTSLSKPSSCPVEQNHWSWTRFGRRGAEIGHALWIRSDDLQQREAGQRSGCFFRPYTLCVHTDVAPARIFLKGHLRVWETLSLTPIRC